jgi:hypothetical protein
MPSKRFQSGCFPETKKFARNSGQADMAFEILVFIVLLNVGATITLWRVTARKPEKLRKKFITVLMSSKPIVPKHQSPKSMGGQLENTFLVTQEDRLFFTDFVDFGAVVNWWLGDEDVGGPWRLQELPNTELSIGFSDTPRFGRRYDIFYNQVRLGTLEIYPGSPYSAEQQIVYSAIELEWVRLLDFDTLHRFLEDIALHVCDNDTRTKEYLQTRVYIDRALSRVLWQNQRITQYNFDGQGYGELELLLEGSPVWYFGRRQALRNKQDKIHEEAKGLVR